MIDNWRRARNRSKSRRSSTHYINATIRFVVAFLSTLSQLIPETSEYYCIVWVVSSRTLTAFKINFARIFSLNVYDWSQSESCSFVNALQRSITIQARLTVCVDPTDAVLVNADRPQLSIAQAILQFGSRVFVWIIKSHSEDNFDISSAGFKFVQHNILERRISLVYIEELEWRKETVH